MSAPPPPSWFRVPSRDRAAPSTSGLPNEAYVACDFAELAGARAALAEAVARHAPTRLVNRVGIVRPATEPPPAERAAFEKLVARRVVPGVGHFMPRERPDAVSAALLELLAAGA